MQATDQTYKDIIAAGDYSFEVVLGITDANGGNYQSLGMDKLFSLSIDNKVFDSEPGIGGVYSGTCEFSFLYEGETIPRMARVTPMYRVTDGTNTSNYVPKGWYFIDTRTITDNGNGTKVFNAFCYDRMSLANKPYTNSGLLWPAEDTDVITEIAQAIGVGVDGRVSTYITQGFLLGEPDGEATLRDYLSYIGVMYGGNWIINFDGLLMFVPLGPNGSFLPREDTYYLSPGEISTLETSPAQPYYTRLKVEISDEEYITAPSWGTDERVLEAYCPFATQASVDLAYDHLGTGRQPFTASGVFADPSIELGDYCVYALDLSDISGTQQFVGRTDSLSITFNQGMPMEISSPHDPETDHEFIYESPEESRTDAAIGSLTVGLNNLGVRNLIINTKNPVASEQSEWPRLYKQKDNTRSSDWEASVATHGIRMTKGSSTQTNAAFQMGGTSPGSSTASMNGLVAGETYTISYKFNYLVLPASTDKAFARWRLIYYTSNTAGATAQTVLLKKIEVTRNEATSKNVSFTFTVPSDAVVCALYFNFCDITDTNIPNSSFRSTDYYEFANLMLVQGNVAATWTPAPEDGVSETSETEPTNGTTKTYELDTNGTYLLTVARANSTVATYDGVYLVAVNTNSHVFNVAKGSNAPSPTISGHTLTVTTTVANQRITITRLS